MINHWSDSEAAAQIKSKQKENEKVDAPVNVTTIVHEAPEGIPEIKRELKEAGWPVRI